MTPTDNPYRALELTQLVDDLGRSGLSSPYTRAGLGMLAEALYDRGVRSRLFAPYRDTELIQSTWDPELEGFAITETGVYALEMRAVDVPQIEPFPTFPRAELPRMVHRLRRKAGLRPVQTQMSEAPGHVECPRCRPDSPCRYHAGSRARLVSARDGAELQVPHPIPERKLPEGVYNVIHFVHQARAHNWSAGDRVSAFVGVPEQGRQIMLGDLEAVLAEIPDVAPRYPTIWAYEQACRTIRERDARIADALTVLEQRPPDPEDLIKVIRDAHETLRLRMPRIEPATEAEKSEVARALEAVTDPNVPVPSEHWPTVAGVLAAEVEHLRTLGETLAEDFDAVVVADPDTGEVAPCGTCSALEPPVRKPAVGRTTAGWPRCAQHLVQDELVAGGYSADVKTCPSCHHLASSHCEDGSGCSVTIRDHGISADSHCPCTFDARSAHRG